MIESKRVIHLLGAYIRLSQDREKEPLRNRALRRKGLKQVIQRLGIR